MAFLLSAFHTRAQTCTAAFSYSQGSNGTIFFNSASVPTHTTSVISWTAPGGTPTFTTGFQPTIVFPSNAVYTITISNNTSTLGCLTSSTQTINVTSWPCTASFSYSQGSNGTVFFNNTSTPSHTTSVISWTAPGGTPAFTTGLQPTIVFPFNGVYTISISNNTSTLGCLTSSTQTVIVSTWPCTATFSYSQGSNGTVFLNSTSSPNHSTSVITWTIPGATPAFTSGAQPTIVFPANGVYTIQISNNSSAAGCLTSSTQTINVTNVPCNVVPSFSFTQGPDGHVSFVNLSAGATSYTWNFGNGQFSALPSPTVSYAANGVYQVTLSASNGSCDSAYITNVVVNTYTCSAAFAYTVTSSGQAGFLSTGLKDTTGFYHWDFGSGTTYTAISQRSAQHSYSLAGTYMVKLMVGTPQNCFDTVAQPVTPCYLSASFSSSLTSPGTYSFSNNTTGNGTPSFTWIVSDGTIMHSIHATHSFSANGTYSVQLLATLGLCSSDTMKQLIVNSIVPCNVTAAFVHTVGANGQVLFRSISSGTLASHQVKWNFGDGTTGAGESETHSYQNAGTHYVTVILSSVSLPNCSDSLTQAINITGIECRADARHVLSKPAGSATRLLIPQYPWNVISALWTWGDGTSSTDLYASHSYTSTGSYEICLTVTVSCGSTARWCDTYSISHAPGESGPIYINVVKPTVQGIYEVDDFAGGMLAYPSPADNILHLRLLEKFMVTEIELYSVNGESLDVRSDRSADGAYEINTANLPAGVYMLRVITSSGIEHLRFVVAR